MEMGFDISEWGFHEPHGVRKWLQQPTDARSQADELKAKRARAGSAIPAGAPHQPFSVSPWSVVRGEISVNRLTACTSMAAITVKRLSSLDRRAHATWCSKSSTVHSVDK
jgi:hypothetical protein